MDRETNLRTHRKLPPARLRVRGCGNFKYANLGEIELHNIPSSLDTFEKKPLITLMQLVAVARKLATCIASPSDLLNA